MRRAKILMGFFLIFVLVVGCQSLGQKTKAGAVIGTISGAGIGGIIGHQSGHAAEGAAIGAAVGALTGAVIGKQMDRNKQAEDVAKSANSAQADKLTLQQIVELTKEGISDEVIIDRIRLTNSKFELTDSVISYLRENKVSERVIAELKK